MIVSISTGLFFVLLLYAANKTTTVPNEVWLPALIVAASCTALFLILRLIFKSSPLASFLSFLLIISVMGFKYWYPLTVIGITLFLCLLIVRIAKVQVKIKTDGFTKAFSIITVCIMLSTIIPIVGNLNSRSIPTLEVGSVNQDYPDIYYIVPDSYDGEWTLAEAGYDNSEFLGFLRKKGFQIPESHFANYARTYMSMASVLSMDYLADTTYNYCYKYIEERNGPNEVIKFLKGKGYNYYRIGYKAWVPNDPYADVDLYYGKGANFARMLLNTTPFSTSYDSLARINLRDDSVYQISQLENLLDFTTPTFVYCHILNPHNGSWGFPGFNADGSYPTDAEVRQQTAREMYFNEVEYINTVLQQVISNILSKPRPCVIIIQADEGYAVQEFDKNNYLPFYDDSLVDSHRIGGEAYNLSAILVPPNYSLPDPGSSNVNTFRLIFNSLFNADYPILPDRFYFGHVIQNNDKEGWPMEDLYDATDMLPHLQEDTSSTIFNSWSGTGQTQIRHWSKTP